MKKVISLLLAILMAFSVVTVAFATEEAPETSDVEATAPVEGEEEGATDFGDLQWILDLPFWTVGPALKFAKIAFKLISAYLKVAKIFGLVDKDMGDMVLEAVLGLIQNSQNGGNTEEAPSEEVAPETEVTTLPAAA